MTIEPIIYDTSGTTLTTRQKIMGHIAIIAAKHDVKTADIMSKGRARKIVRARNEAIRWVYMSKRPEFSVADVGRFFGMDHSSILFVLGRLSAKRLPAAWKRTEREVREGNHVSL